MRLPTILSGQRHWRGLQPPRTAALMPGPLHAQAVHSGLTPAHDQALLAWRQWCLANAGRRVRLALSCQWVLSGLIHEGDVGGAAQASERMARQWMNHGAPMTTTNDGGWRWRATRVGDAWLVCATPETLVGDILAVARAHGVKLIWLGPWWVAGAQCWVERLARLAKVSGTAQLQVQEPGWVMNLRMDGGRLAALWSEPLAPVQVGLEPDKAIETTVLSFAPLGHATADVLWDDERTRSLVDGKAAWQPRGA